MLRFVDHAQRTREPANQSEGRARAGAGIPVLVVDDDVEIRRMIAAVLRRDGEFRPIEASDGAAALELARLHTHALMLLDITLPDRSGLDVLRELRKGGDRPVILLTGRGSETDRVLGLELGADDYVTKPCYPREVVARVRAVLRRSSPTVVEPAVLCVGEVRIEPGARLVSVAGRPVDLAAREFDLLVHLARQPGRVFRRAELLADVWESQEGWQRDSTVTEHVFRVRTKLGVAEGDAGWVQTVRNVGYRLMS